MPRRGHGRGRTRKERSEKWIVCRFLATIAKTNLLEFPVRVEPSERPDLVLTTSSGNIGIEITDAVPNNKARVDAYLANEGSEDFCYIPGYKVNDPPCTNAEIEKIAKGQMENIPLMGDCMERDWVEAMLHYTKRKAANFRKRGFTKHSKNWLLIYDNWSPAAGRNNDIAAERLGQHIFALNANNPFCRVFVQRPRNIWDFTNEMGVVEYPIPMDWCAS